jgi:DNA-binding transcriptional LysR family regulator
VIKDLKLRQLRLLVALENEGKLQLAAERLNISQSAASKMLAEIEGLTRVPLFDRTARGVKPTPLGAILIRGGRSVLAHLDQVTDEFAGYRTGELGTVAVGTIAKPGVDLVVDVMLYLGEKIRRVNFGLEIGSSPALVDRLIAQEFDFIIARIPGNSDPGQFEYHEIGTEEAALLVRSDHPLADHKDIALEDIVDLQWICQPRKTFMRQSVEQLFVSRGISPPKRVISTESYFASLGIAAGVDAIVPVPLLAFDLVDPRRFRRLGIRDKLMLGGYGLIKLRERTLSPAAMLLFEAMGRIALSSGNSRQGESGKA